jgi:hypothetical protein
MSDLSNEELLAELDRLSDELRQPLTKPSDDRWIPKGLNNASTRPTPRTIVR